MFVTKLLPFAIFTFLLVGCSSNQEEGSSPYVRAPYFGKTDTPNDSSEHLFAQGIRYVYEGEENDHFVKYEFFSVGGNVSLEKTCTIKDTEAWPLQVRRVSGASSAVIGREVMVIAEGFKSSATMKLATRDVVCEIDVAANSLVGFDVVGDRMALYLPKGLNLVLEKRGVVVDFANFKGLWNQRDNDEQVVASLNIDGTRFTYKSPCTMAQNSSGSGNELLNGQNIKWNTISGDLAGMVVYSTPQKVTGVIQPTLTLNSECQDTLDSQLQPTPISFELERVKNQDGSILTLLSVKSDLIDGKFFR